MRTRSLTPATVLAVVLLGSLAGCSDDDPAPDGDSDPMADASEATEQGVVTEDGDSTVTTYGRIPPGFPEDVPVLSPEDATGSVTEYDEVTSYSVVVESDRTAGDTLRDAAVAVADAGFSGDTEVAAEEDVPLPVVLERAEPETVVVLSAVPVDTGSLVTYTVEVS